MLKNNPPQKFQPNHKAAEALKNIENFTRLLDNQFRIPGTDFKFGIDPLIGLIPIAGDIVSFGLQAMLFSAMLKYGASRKIVILMALNILVDFIIGGIPVIGNIFDFGFKANQRNLQLLKKHYQEGKYQGSGSGIIIILLLVTLLIVGFLGYLTFLLTRYVVNLF